MVDDLCRRFGIRRFELFYQAFKEAELPNPNVKAAIALQQWENGHMLNQVVANYVKRFQRDPPEGGNHG